MLLGSGLVTVSLLGNSWLPSLGPISPYIFHHAHAHSVHLALALALSHVASR